MASSVETALSEGGMQILSRQDVADRYGVPVQTISAWRHKGYGPRSFRVGRYTRYRLADCLEWEEQQLDPKRVG